LPDRTPHRLRLILAFAVVYLIWSSTYLGIRVCVQMAPPFLFSGARNLLAGLIVLLGAWLCGVPFPSWNRARPAVVMGLFLFLGGNGAVAWAETRIPSGVAALVLATTPLWMVLIHRVQYRGERLGWAASVGLWAGFAGAAVLADPFGVGGESLNPVGVLVLTLASLSWSLGSVWGKNQTLPESPWMASGIQMASGGAALLVLSGLSGEWRPGVLSRVTPTGVWTFAYLVLFGTIAGFTAFYYILKNTAPHVASSYAYVNPVVAVFLGWLILGEPLTWRVLAASALIVPGVLAMTLIPMKRSDQKPLPRGRA
jgi:drug/metabolite transporter (DMT)-like permease